ncbi:MAG: TetR/AcrR family transcriptional regulator [Spirochaetota bacterium]
MTRREKIVNSARVLFSRQGFSATGLRQIAEKAGVSLGNIYNHFRNKDELFDELLDPKTIIETLSGTFREITEDFPFNIDRLILAVKKSVDSNRDLFKLMFIDLSEFEGRHTDRMMRYFISTGKEVFARQLESKSRTGKLKDLDYEFFIKLFIISSMSFFASSHILPSLRIDRYSDEEVAAMLSGFILTGIRR